jgi:ribosome-binding factor A
MEKMTIKQERMQDTIREILSSLMLFEVTDPALQGVTVTEVILDREIEYADCYVSALGDDSRQKEVMAGLGRANGFLRRELGKRLKLRRVPVLHFHWDITLARAEVIEQAIDRLDLPPSPKPAKKRPESAEETEDTDE